MRRKPPYYRWIMVNDGNDSKTTLFYCRFLPQKSLKTTVLFIPSPSSITILVPIFQQAETGPMKNWTQAVPGRVDLFTKN